MLKYILTSLFSLIAFSASAEELKIVDLNSSSANGIVLTFNQDVKVTHSAFGTRCYSEIIDYDATISALNAKPSVVGNVVTLAAQYCTFVDGHRIHMALNPECFTTLDGSVSLTGETEFDFIMGGQGFEVILLTPSSGKRQSLNDINITFKSSINKIVKRDGITVKNERNHTLPIKTVEILEGGESNALHIAIESNDDIRGQTTYSVNIEEGSIECGETANITLLKVGQWFIDIAPRAEAITLSDNKIVLPLGSNKTLTAEITPQLAIQSVNWSSSDETVAKVENGTVKAVGLGKATITATTTDGTDLKTTCDVTVNPIYIESISFSQDSYDVYTGSYITLNPVIAPSNSTIKELTWKTSDENIATVDGNGTVLAKNVGVAKITASSTDGGGAEKSCTIVVKPILITNISFDKPSYAMTIEDEMQLSVNIEPANATSKDVTWSVSDSNILSVKDGKIKALNIGTATVYVMAQDGSGISASCVVNVSPRYISDIILNEEQLDLIVGDKARLSATIFPTNATNKTLSWTSNDESIATITDGYVIAKKEGSTQIVVKALDGSGVQAVCNITVRIIPVTDILLGQSKAELSIGGLLQLEPVVLPSNATFKQINWSSSNNYIAEVSEEGLIRAKSVGNATIYAKSTDGSNVESICEVTVLPTLVSSITIVPNILNIREGEAATLRADITPSDATFKDVVWSTLDENIATVTENGVVEGKKVGKTYVVAHTTDGSGLTAQCEVNVTPILISSIHFESESYSIIIGKTIRILPIIYPSNATYQDLLWDSSDDDLATVDEYGTVTTKGVGKVVIYANTIDGSNLRTSYVLNILPIQATALTLGKNILNMKVGEEYTLTYQIKPVDATYKDVVWTSSDETVVTVDKGKVTAQKTGEAIITVRTTDGSNLTATCEVFVEQVNIESIIFDQKAYTIQKGDTQEIGYSIVPNNATYKNLEWVSNDEEIATVTDGIVTAHEVGATIITAKATDGTGVYTMAVVTVTPVDGISVVPLSPSEIEGIYDMSGKRKDNISKGLNIIKTVDGKIYKIFR